MAGHDLARFGEVSRHALDERLPGVEQGLPLLRREGREKEPGQSSAEPVRRPGRPAQVSVL